MKTKICSKCKKRLPISCFFKRNNRLSGHTSQCKYCKGKYKKNWRRTVKGKLCQRRNWLKFRYNITLIEYDEIFEEQNGVCAICGRVESIMGRRLAVDHDHKTGKVRGLLCYRCNTRLGILEENSNLLLVMLNYLSNTSK